MSENLPCREWAAAPVLPKGTDLKPFRADYLTAVAEELNGRPRKTLIREGLLGAPAGDQTVA